MPTNRVGSPQTNRYSAELRKALGNDGKIDKQEGRKLRQRAVESLAWAPNRATAAKAFSDDFARLVDKAADRSSATYLNTVSAEFASRSRYQNASNALQKYLTKHAATLPAELKNIDARNGAGFEVGTSMNRGLWLRVPLKDRSMYYESTRAAEELFNRIPELKKFGEIYVIS